MFTFCPLYDIIKNVKYNKQLPVGRVKGGYDMKGFVQVQELKVKRPVCFMKYSISVIEIDPIGGR